MLSPQSIVTLRWRFHVMNRDIPLPEASQRNLKAQVMGCHIFLEVVVVVEVARLIMRLVYSL